MQIFYKGKFRRTGTFVSCLIFFLGLLTLSVFFPTDEAASLPARRQSNSCNLQMRVDAKERARAYCNNVQVVLSLAEYFEFFQRRLSGERIRIAHGPWNGHLREINPGKYILSGSDPKSSAAYLIAFTQVDASSLEINLTFTAPSNRASLGFDIVKLSSDLFINAPLEASPAKFTDVDAIPIQPLSFLDRMLLTNKNRILLKGIICDLEITDLTNSHSIYAADGRNVPWDKRKSILLGVNSDNLVPHEQYSFKYSIRSMPPSGGTVLDKIQASGRPVSSPNIWTFYSTPPKTMTNQNGAFLLQASDPIFGVSGGAAETALLKELSATTSMLLSIKPSNQTAQRGIFIERAPQGQLPAEGFEIIASPQKITIRGADERGCLYGAYALMGQLRQKGAGWVVACGKISDWPDLPVRGACIELLKPAIRDIALMKRYLDALSKARANTIILLHLPQQARSWREGRDDGGWTRAQIAEIVQYARSLNMDVWGGMGSAFSPTDFPTMNIRQGTNIYNPLREESYTELFSLYDQILQTYRPSTLLISHDEIKGLSFYAAEAGKSTADVFAMDISRIHAWLGTHKVKTAIWGDMLLDHTIWESKVGSANSLNPEYASGATHQALSRIPRDTIIIDWHYREKGSYPSIDYFRRQGFRVIGAAWHEPGAAKAMATSVKNFSGQGIIATDWGIWATLSPAATTLYAPLCGWSSKCTVQNDDRDAIALAESMRDPAFSESTPSQFPISLASVVNGSTDEAVSRECKNFFGIGPALDLRAFPIGRNVFAGVHFDIAPNSSGQLNNCVVVGNITPGSGPPIDEIVFQGSASAKKISFLHTTFVESPQTTARKLGQYIIEFESGELEIIDLLENWNITDVRSSAGIRNNVWSFVRSPDTLVGAKPAWRGLSAAGIPLNLQVFIWKNSHPDKRIRSIRLSAAGAPLNTKVALLGLTILQ